MTDKNTDAKATKPAKAIKAPKAPLPTTVDAATPPAEPKEKPVAKKQRPTKSQFVDVTVKVHGLEDYKASGKRGSTMKAARAWIRERGLTVRMTGVERTETPDPAADGHNEFITYVFTEKCLQDANITPKAPQPRGKKAEGEGKAKPKSEKKNAKAAAKPKTDPKPDAETKVADW